MKRYSVAYTVEEDEFNTELQRLMITSGDYIKDYWTIMHKINLILAEGSHELVLQEVAKLRQALAKADYRLHDVMGLIAAQDRPVTVAETPPTMTTEGLSASLEEVKRNIEALGIDVSEEHMMRMLKEKASND